MIKVHFFERYNIQGIVSVEKVFKIVIPAIKEKGFSVKKINNPFASIAKIFQAGLYLKKHQGDLNHITGDIHWASLFLDSSKTVLTIHDFVGSNNYRGLKKQLYLLLWLYLPVLKTKYITVISNKTKNELLKYYPSAIKKIRVIPNPLTYKIERKEIKEIKPEQIKLLIVGTRENKNVEKILKACVNMMINITIVGEVNMNWLVNYQQSRINIEVNVSDERLEELYLFSDILCFPSLYEGFGMPIIEAQAKGCAVITSNREPMVSVAGNGALFVDPENIDEIRNSIVNLCDNFSLRAELVEKGYKNAEKYNPENIAQKYKELYLEILNKRL